VLNDFQPALKMASNLLNEAWRLGDVDTICMFCGSSISFRLKLLHKRYCSVEHKDAYFHAMDRLGLERLAAARPRIDSHEPCTKPVEIAVQLPSEPPKAPKFAAPRIRPHLELGQGEAAVATGL